MIVQEYYMIGDRQFVRTYSDSNRYVVGGEPIGEYAEANDPVDAQRTYVEGGPIPSEESDAQEILDILLGGEVE